MKRKLICLFLAIWLALACGCSHLSVDQTALQYEAAKEQMNTGNYLAAADQFEALGSYEDCTALALECRYSEALLRYAEGDYAGARDCFALTPGYKHADTLTTDCSYRVAVSYFESGDYAAAQTEFEALGEYSDALYYLERCEAKTDPLTAFLHWMERHGEPDGADFYADAEPISDTEEAHFYYNTGTGELFFNLYRTDDTGLTCRTCLCLIGASKGAVDQLDYRYEPPVYAEATALYTAGQAFETVELDAYSDYYAGRDVEQYSVEAITETCRTGLARIAEVLPDCFESLQTEIAYSDLGFLTEEKDG